jgi:ATP-dependent exoDNAse (exonuclease V) alpha subunit
MACEEFKQVLLDAIGETFSSLGESPKQSIIFHLENTFNLKTCRYCEDIAGFDRALKDVFGPGAIMIETLIISKLTEKAMKIQNDTEKQLFCSDIKCLNDLWQKNP